MAACDDVSSINYACGDQAYETLGSNKKLTVCKQRALSNFATLWGKCLPVGAERNLVLAEKQGM